MTLFLRFSGNCASRNLQLDLRFAHRDFEKAAIFANAILLDAKAIIVGYTCIADASKFHQLSPCFLFDLLSLLLATNSGHEISVSTRFFPVSEYHSFFSHISSIVGRQCESGFRWRTLKLKVGVLPGPR